MKKVVFGFFLSLVLISFAVAQVCDLDATFVNQDPYPAVPGDYVKLVFQLEGVENSRCGEVSFTLLEQYPISFDPDENPTVVVQGGTFTKDHSSFLMVPYKVRVDENALDGDNPLEVVFLNTGESPSSQSKQFDLYIEDVRVDFEIYVKDYDVISKIATFEVLNIAESDIEALTLEIPDQEGVIVKGPSRNIVGDLDSSEYTTADFEMSASEGDIEMIVYYTDEAGVRRSTSETVSFDPTDFEGRSSDAEGSIWPRLIILLVIVAGAGYYFYRKRKKKKLKRK